MMTKERSTKIVKCMNPRAGGLVLGCDHINHKVKMHYLLLKIYSTLIAIVLRDYNAAFLCHC